MKAVVILIAVMISTAVYSQDKLMVSDEFKGIISSMLKEKHRCEYYCLQFKQSVKVSEVERDSAKLLYSEVRIKFDALIDAVKLNFSLTGDTDSSTYVDLLNEAKQANSSFISYVKSKKFLIKGDSGSGDWVIFLLLAKPAIDALRTALYDMLQQIKVGKLFDQLRLRPFDKITSKTVDNLAETITNTTIENFILSLLQ